MAQRRLVAAAAALVLVAEAVGVVLVCAFLGMVVEEQQMSLAGLDPRLTTVSAWIAGGLFGLYLLSCVLVLLRSAVRDTAPGRFLRALLLVCAVVQGVLGAVTAALVGWSVFAFLMVELALLVFTLVWYGGSGRDGAVARRGDTGGGADPQPEPVA